jgi:hypothetical protein
METNFFLPRYLDNHGLDVAGNWATIARDGDGFDSEVRWYLLGDVAINDVAKRCFLDSNSGRV